MTNTKQLLLTYMDALRAFDKRQPRVYDFWTLPEYAALQAAEDALLDRDRVIETFLQTIADSFGGDPMHNVKMAEQALDVLRGKV